MLAIKVAVIFALILVSPSMVRSETIDGCYFVYKAEVLLGPNEDYVPLTSIKYEELNWKSREPDNFAERGSTNVIGLPRLVIDNNKFKPCLKFDVKSRTEVSIVYLNAEEFEQWNNGLKLVQTLQDLRKNGRLPKGNIKIPIYNSIPSWTK